MTSLISASTSAQIQALRQKRLDSFMAASGAGVSSRDHLVAAANGTTVDDLDVLREAREALDKPTQELIALLLEVQSDYSRGYRCGVCGMTSAQAAAANYNCAQEC